MILYSKNILATLYIIFCEHIILLLNRSVSMKTVELNIFLFFKTFSMFLSSVKYGS